MASERVYRRRWMRQRRQYEKIAMVELMRVFNEWGRTIEWDKMDSQNFRSLIDVGTDAMLLTNAFYEFYVQIGVIHGARIGKQINEDIEDGDKEFVFGTFMTRFEREIIGYLQGFVGSKIVTIEKTYHETLYALLRKEVAENKTVREAATSVKKFVAKPDFYQWQALRIARTEATGAANYAATISGEVSGFEMEKVWLSALDTRTRPDHRALNQDRVGLNDPFIIDEGTPDADVLRFPGDPKGRAENVINCRCTVTIVVKRDENGNRIRV